MKNSEAHVFIHHSYFEQPGTGAWGRGEMTLTSSEKEKRHPWTRSYNRLTFEQSLSLKHIKHETTSNTTQQFQTTNTKRKHNGQSTPKPTHRTKQNNTFGAKLGTRANFGSTKGDANLGTKVGTNSGTKVGTNLVPKLAPTLVPKLLPAGVPTSVEKQCTRHGGMAACRQGGMAAWRHGLMAAWRH